MKEVKRKALFWLWLAAAGTAAALLGETPAGPPPFYIRPIQLFNEHLYEGAL